MPKRDIPKAHGVCISPRCLGNNRIRRSIEARSFLLPDVRSHTQKLVLVSLRDRFSPAICIDKIQYSECRFFQRCSPENLGILEKQ